MKKIVCCALISAALSSVASMCFTMSNGEMLLTDNLDYQYRILQSYWQLEGNSKNEDSDVNYTYTPNFSPIPNMQDSNTLGCNTCEPFNY